MISPKSRLPRPSQPMLPPPAWPLERSRSVTTSSAAVSLFDDSDDDEGEEEVIQSGSALRNPIRSARRFLSRGGGESGPSPSQHRVHPGSGSYSSQAESPSPLGRYRTLFRPSSARGDEGSESSIYGDTSTSSSSMESLASSSAMLFHISSGGSHVGYSEATQAGKTAKEIQRPPRPPRPANQEILDLSSTFGGSDTRRLPQPKVATNKGPPVPSKPTSRLGGHHRIDSHSKGVPRRETADTSDRVMPSSTTAKIQLLPESGLRSQATDSADKLQAKPVTLKYDTSRRPRHPPEYPCKQSRGGVAPATRARQRTMPRTSLLKPPARSLDGLLQDKPPPIASGAMCPPEKDPPRSPENFDEAVTLALLYTDQLVSPRSFGSSGQTDSKQYLSVCQSSGSSSRRRNIPSPKAAPCAPLPMTPVYSATSPTASEKDREIIDDILNYFTRDDFDTSLEPSFLSLGRRSSSRSLLTSASTQRSNASMESLSASPSSNYESDGPSGEVDGAEKSRLDAMLPAAAAAASVTNLSKMVHDAAAVPCVDVPGVGTIQVLDKSLLMPANEHKRAVGTGFHDPENLYSQIVQAPDEHSPLAVLNKGSCKKLAHPEPVRPACTVDGTLGIQEGDHDNETCQYASRISRPCSPESFIGATKLRTSFRSLATTREGSVCVTGKESSSSDEGQGNDDYDGDDAVLDSCAATVSSPRPALSSPSDSSPGSTEEPFRSSVLPLKEAAIDFAPAPSLLTMAMRRKGMERA